LLKAIDPTSSVAINLTGNELVQTIRGSAGANVLDGKGGADTLEGLGGDDRYFVDSAFDDVVEVNGGGTDEVIALTSYVLDAGVSIETLRTTGSASAYLVNLVGNELDNSVFGNSAANVLLGKAGNDTMIGNAGNDIFHFDTAPDSANNFDRILDFDVDAPGVADSFDTLQLDNAVYTLLGAPGDLAAGLFASVVDAADADNGGTITYVSSTGNLFYDTNGAADGGAIRFAQLSAGLALTHADFVVA
jgi:Ca2+-binding RTX toxin-like protein